MKKVTAKPLTSQCAKCGHKWTNRIEKPLKCPKCGHILGTKVYKKKRGNIKP